MNYLLVSNVKETDLNKAVSLLKFTGEVDEDATDLSKTIRAGDEEGRFLGIHNDFIILTDAFVPAYFIRMSRQKGEYEKHLVKNFPDSNILMASSDEDENQGFSIVYFSKGRKLYIEQLDEDRYIRCGDYLPYYREIIKKNKSDKYEGYQYSEGCNLDNIYAEGYYFVANLIYFFLGINDLSTVPMHRIEGRLSDEFVDENHYGADFDGVNAGFWTF